MLPNAVQGQQPGLSRAAVAEQLQATVRELLGFAVPADQVCSSSWSSTSHDCMQRAALSNHNT